jgi:DNA-damage-inducible protein D
MANNITKRAPTGNDSPFEIIKRINDAGNEYWSSRDFSQILCYSDYRNFEQVIKKAKAACFNSGQRIEDHFVDITEMVGLKQNKERDSKINQMSKMLITDS